MGKASHLLPSGVLFKNNPMIFESLKQGVQVVLNKTDVDGADNPVLHGSAKLPKKSTGAVLPFHKLYLAAQVTPAQKLLAWRTTFGLSTRFKLLAFIPWKMCRFMLASASFRKTSASSALPRRRSLVFCQSLPACLMVVLQVCFLLRLVLKPRRHPTPSAVVKICCCCCCC